MIDALYVFGIEVPDAVSEFIFWCCLDIAILLEKAALCLRIARRLSWNNPGRLRLTELAQRFDQQARDLELQIASATAAISGPNPSV